MYVHVTVRNYQKKIHCTAVSASVWELEVLLNMSLVLFCTF